MLPICIFSEFFTRVADNAVWTCVVLIHDEEQGDELLAALLGRPNAKVTMVSPATHDMELEKDGPL